MAEMAGSEPALDVVLSALGAIARFVG